MGKEDIDMQRATDLLDLHYGVKVKQAAGLDEGLKQARRDVDRVVRELDAEER